MSLLAANSQKIKEVRINNLFLTNEGSVVKNRHFFWAKLANFYQSSPKIINSFHKSALLHQIVRENHKNLNYQKVW